MLILLSRASANCAKKFAAAYEQRGEFLWEGRATVRGQTRWLHIESHPTVLPNRPPFWTGVVFDVTERRDMEQALRQQHSLLAGTLEATADGILLKPVTAVTIRRLRGILKRKPGENTFAEEWAEHKREERKLEDANYARSTGAR